VNQYRCTHHLIRTYLLKGLLAFILIAALSACGEAGSSGDDSLDTSSDVGDPSVGVKALLLEGVAIEIGDEWLYRKGTSAAPSDWMTAGFDDTSWLPGNTGLGYGDGDDETILADMPGNYTTVYTRKALNYDGSFNINSLMLEIGYDDGFVAYINGQEVARDNMPAGQPSFDTQAITAIEPTTGFYDLSGFISLIGNGDNVLAIEVHNASITSSDLSFLPRLTVNMGESQPPVVTITNGSGTYVMGDTVTLTGTATDAEDGTITGYLAWSSSIDGSIAGSGGTVSTNTLSLGTHTITASVTDSHGDSDSDTTSITISLTPPPPQPPVVTITNGSGTYIAGDTVVLTGTATDAEDGTITGNLSWNSSIDGPIPGSGGSVSTSTLSLGTHTITASVTDTDGNSDSDTISVTVDAPVNNPPLVAITGGVGTYIQGDTVTLTGTATDVEDGTITGSLAWSSSIDGSIPGSGGTVSTNTLSIGTHTITASVIDSDGNSDSDTISLTISASGGNGTTLTDCSANAETYQTTLNVPGDYGSIGEALRSARNSGQLDVKIIVAPGNYGSLSGDLGSFDRALVIASEPYKAQISNINLAGGDIAHNITFEGFEFGSTGSASVIKLDGGRTTNLNIHHVVFRNNVIRDPGSNDGVKVNAGANHITFERNIIYNNNDDNMDLNSVADVFVHDNIFFAENGDRNLLVIKDSTSIGDPDFYRGTKNVSVKRNIFLNYRGGGNSAMIYLGEDGDKDVHVVQNAIIENNLFIGNGDLTGLAAPIAMRGVRDITIRNNTFNGKFSNTKSWAFLVWAITGAGGRFNTEDLYIYNNVWANNENIGVTRFSLSDDEDTGDFLIDHNLYWNNGSSIPQSGQGVINYTDDANRVEQDPRLPDVPSTITLPTWNAAQASFADGSSSVCEAFEKLVQAYGQPAAGSPVVDAGILNVSYESGDLSSSDDVTIDILGNPRTNAPDLGAVELD